MIEYLAWAFCGACIGWLTVGVIEGIIRARAQARYYDEIYPRIKVNSYAGLFAKQPPHDVPWLHVAALMLILGGVITVAAFS
jgi:hypothetical protein